MAFLRALGTPEEYQDRSDAELRIHAIHNRRDHVSWIKPPSFALQRLIPYLLLKI
jgi:hypothetical protein